MDGLTSFWRNDSDLWGLASVVHHAVDSGYLTTRAQIAWAAKITAMIAAQREHINPSDFVDEGI